MVKTSCVATLIDLMIKEIKSIFFFSQIEGEKSVNSKYNHYLSINVRSQQQRLMSQRLPESKRTDEVICIDTLALFFDFFLEICRLVKKL